jgi:hypothetical protein
MGALKRLIHYVHLNPVRAGLVKKRDGIEGYPWCSLSDYVKPKRSRRKWVAVERGLTHLELPDTAPGRRDLLEWTEGLIDWEKPWEAGNTREDGQTLNSTLRRGWYFGGEEFRERLVAKLERLKPGSPPESRRKGYSAEQIRDHGKKEAERIIAVAAKVFGQKTGNWDRMPKGDWRKGMGPDSRAGARPQCLGRAAAWDGGHWRREPDDPVGARSRGPRSKGEALGAGTESDCLILLSPFSIALFSRRERAVDQRGGNVLGGQAVHLVFHERRDDLRLPVEEIAEPEVFLERLRGIPR